MSAVEIARALGVALRSGGWWRCRCPLHDSRDATLALRDGERGLIVKCFAGCDPRDVLVELHRRQLIAGPGAPQRRAQAIPAGARTDDDAGRIAAARRLWEAARDARGSPVVRYLAGRGITIPTPPSLRWVPRLRHPSGVCMPAMLAAIVDAAGELIGVHRTYLRSDGSGKAGVERPKAMLGRAAGGAVRLAPPCESLAVAGGIETALAAMQATAIPAWAALSTSGLVALVLPPMVCAVLILVDHDRSGAGERAARAAAQRWLAEGRRVRLAMPPEPGTDFNDVLLGHGHTRIAEPCNAA
jgi:putative DNA primase/helicase